VRNLFQRVHRHLDPGDSLGELIFGLIMVMTFTLGTRLLSGGEPVDGTTLMIAAIGCNIAWGIIDAFLFVLGRVYERRRLASVADFLRQADTAAARDMVAGEFDGALAGMADEAERDKFYRAIAAAARRHPPARIKIHADDIKGAVIIFFLVLGTAIPAALPFLLIADGETALRVSNAVLVGCLFVVGSLWGRHVGSTPWVAGLLVMSLGAAMALIAVPLGG
jgi:hypothetical protein